MIKVFLKKKSILVVVCSALVLTSCSNKPVEFYARKKQSTPTQHQKQIVETKSSTTETIYTNNNSATNLLLSSNPYGVAAQSDVAPQSESRPIVTQPQVSPVVVTPTDYLTLLKNPATTSKSAENIIDTKLSASQLDSALRDQSLIQFRPQVLFKLGQNAQKEKKQSQALEYYRALVAQFSSHALAAQANSMITLIQSTQDVDAKVIGAILPLSGKNANVGQHALNALRMGLGLNKPNPHFQLAVFDSQSLSEQAVIGVDKLLKDDKVIALIGGLSSKEAALIAQRSDMLGVPFMALSQKSGLTNIGDYVFRNSLTPEMQVDQLVQFAFEKLNAKKFAVLYPNDIYGVEFSNFFWDHVLAHGGQITAAQTYDPKENDFTAVIQKLVGTYYPEGRAEEYKDRLEQIDVQKKEKAGKNKNKPVVKNSREHETEENILPPIIDFDVLFLPDSGKTLGQVIAFMKVNDVSKLTYLGTNIWNTPEIVKRSTSQTENIYFVDALNPADTAVRETPFFKDYFEEYKEEPTLIEMQSYESAKIISDIVSTGATTREQLASRLRIMGRSSGVTGELRMSNQREIERPIHVLSLDGGLVKKVN